jgi:hypothetical protein
VVSFNDYQCKLISEMPLRGEIAIPAWVSVEESLTEICKSGLHLSFPELEAMRSIYPVWRSPHVSHHEGRPYLQHLYYVSRIQARRDASCVQTALFVP